jgi:hypothetical protein
MIAILLVAVIAGSVCGSMRLKVWAIIPATAIYSLITIIDGVIAGLGAGIIALRLVIGATVLQLFYLIGSLVFEEQKRRTPSPKPLRPELIHAMQSAIGQGLRIRFPLPQDLPQELSVHVAQLKARYG